VSDSAGMETCLTSASSNLTINQGISRVNLVTDTVTYWVFRTPLRTVCPATNRRGGIPRVSPSNL
jgi:hypothetical protein